MRDLLQDEFFIKLVNNPDEDTRHYWHRWLEKHPERKEDFEFAKQTAQSIRYKNQKQLSQSEYDSIFMELRGFLKAETDSEPNLQLGKTKTIWSYFGKVAAVVLLALSIGLIVYFNDNKTDKNEIAEVEEMMEKSVPLGAKNTIRLTDGTVVKLNAGSQLMFPKNFSAAERYVELKGEAYFDVTRDVNRPFIIKTGDVNTKVLGTSFNVRHYSNESKIEIALVSGKVEVEDIEGNITTLTPSEMAVYSKVDHSLTKQHFNKDLTVGWKDNILVFEKATMEIIKDRLEKWYGVKIEIALTKPIAGLYSGAFKDEPLNVVLEGIGYASKFEFEINNKNVTIKN